mmetsp:Transcript_4464/g.13978  ORF Transcript_4464/g.13978 Transcript_4464/m.13978 type:complete len:246 (+) Transcript_4464:1-738(+)
MTSCRRLCLLALSALCGSGFQTPPSTTRRRVASRAAEFVVSDLSQPPTDEALTNENLVKIVREECSDDQVNALVWQCLGYRLQQDGTYDATEVFPKWRARFPEPPDLVGITRVYSKEVDEPVLRANQALVASIPMSYKAGIKTHLRKVGFTGFMLEGLTPNKTRRAQCTNWILYYREALFGVDLETLIQQKQRDVAAENQRLREQGKSLRVATAAPAGSGPSSSDSSAPAASSSSSSTPAAPSSE